MIYQVSGISPGKGQVCREKILCTAGNDAIGSDGSVPLLPARRRLPPSAKKIFAVFDDRQLHTVQELRKKTGFSIRCTRYAVQILKENHLIIAKFNFKDARQPLYQRAGIIEQSQDFTRPGSMAVTAI